MVKDELLHHLRLHFSQDASETKNFTALDLLHKYGSPLTALLYSHLFWPLFIEIDGMVFLADSFEDPDDYERLRKAMHRLKGDRRKIEESFNLVEIPSLFGRSMSDTSDEEDELLASILRDIWSARLQQQFPNLAFDVEVVAASETGGEIGLLFRQR